MRDIRTAAALIAVAAGLVGRNAVVTINRQGHVIDGLVDRYTEPGPTLARALRPIDRGQVVTTSDVKFVDRPKPKGKRARRREKGKR